MTGRITSHRQLLDAFQNVAVRFENAKADITHREANFFEALRQLQSDLDKAAQGASKSQIAAEHPLAVKVKDYIDNFAEHNRKWHKGVADHARNTEFRSQYSDSLLVFVYGKVKTGKSSLGNYVAWGKSSPGEETIKSHGAQPPKFEVHQQSAAKNGDTKNEAKNRQLFKIGELETTSSIQTFTLPGLTWVDSPGIHSMQGENGQLAKNYVSSADLVIYTMSSQQPGRRSDLEEIFALVEQRKPLLILLTGSDLIESDEDQDGKVFDVLTMKSAEDRKSQVDYVTSELSAIESSKRNLLLAEVLPISVKFAEANEGDQIRYKDSGLSRLFERMAEIAEGDGVELKLATPLNNLRAFGNSLQESQQVLADQITKLGEFAETESKNIASIESHVIADIKRSIAAEITVALNRFRGDSQKISSHLNEALRSKTTQRVSEELEALFFRMDVSVQKSLDDSNVPPLPGFQDKNKVFKVSDQGKKSALGSGAGAVAGSVAGAFIGSVVPFVGTALGAWLGGLVGGALGSGAGSALASDVIFTEKVGDNLQDVEASAHEIYMAAVEQLVHKAMMEATKDGFESIQRFVIDSQKTLENFNSRVKKEVLQ